MKTSAKSRSTLKVKLTVLEMKKFFPGSELGIIHIDTPSVIGIGGLHRISILSIARYMVYIIAHRSSDCPRSGGIIVHLIVKIQVT